MKPNSDQSTAPGTKPGSKPAPKDDLKSLPLAEVEKKLASSPDGLTQAEAQKRLTQYGPNEIEEKKTNRAPEIPRLFLGSHPVDDRSRRDPVGGGPALAGLWHYPRSALRQCRGRILGGTPGGQRHSRPKGHAGVLGTQALATPIAVYGLLMTPLGWGWALFVWGYALAWFLVNDRVKLLAYRILDPAKTSTLPDLTPAALSASVV